MTRMGISLKSLKIPYSSIFYLLQDDDQLKTSLTCFLIPDFSTSPWMLSADSVYVVECSGDSWGMFKCSKMKPFDAQKKNKFNSSTLEIDAGVNRKNVQETHGFSPNQWEQNRQTKSLKTSPMMDLCVSKYGGNPQIIQLIFGCSIFFHYTRSILGYPQGSPPSASEISYSPCPRSSPRPARGSSSCPQHGDDHKRKLWHQDVDLTYIYIYLYIYI